jgi:signal transduction histidine kinase
VKLIDARGETREYLVNASPLLLARTSPDPLLQRVTAEDALPPTIPGAVVVWHDVTEARRLLLEQRVHAETEARRALLQTILDELPSSVYLVRGRDARLVLANRAATSVWGAQWPVSQPMSEFLAANAIRISAVDGRPLPLEHLATVRAVHGETIFQHQEVIRRPDGTSLPVLVNAVALNMRNLNVLSLGTRDHTTEEPEPAAIVVHQDVTALKEAERLKDEFLSIAAHELRTPLAVLKGFAQTLLVQTARGKGPELADWQKESLQDIDQSTTRLVELIDDLLDVTRLQAGRLAFHRQPTDLVALARRVIAHMQMTTEEHEMMLSTSSEHLVVDVDPRRMEQVLSNLIGNAIKYSPQGG